MGASPSKAENEAMAMHIHSETGWDYIWQAMMIRYAGKEQVEVSYEAKIGCRFASDFF